MDLVYHSTLGLRVIKKKTNYLGGLEFLLQKKGPTVVAAADYCRALGMVLLCGPRRKQFPMKGCPVTSAAWSLFCAEGVQTPMA